MLCVKESGKHRSSNKCRQREGNAVPASPGVFGLQPTAYHSNHCSNPTHLGSRPQRLRIIEAGGLKIRPRVKEKEVREAGEGGMYR